VTDTQVAAALDAAVDPTPDAAGDADAVVVRLGTGRFAVELASVAEVGRVPLITRVPGLPSWLSGVANWRGRILPVLDLRPLLGAEASELDAHARLLVLTGSGVAVGMVVDGVEGTTVLEGVAGFPLTTDAGGSALLSGQVARSDGPVAVLDVAGVLRLRDALPRGRRTA
jgi:purine-binding chemotaxis protein CheW